ncbi:MAG: hypothetical protein UV61_C0016G0001 [Candidatus Gottesmanbacteria bacterium GW2011_GWB1_43_11]|uniref:M23ase beta-sheet core domain-containing protein n=1 Tax=Candidatus Gottesmanbacteria bacterium GW2011_GWB1_43_11 TaxID=1618446 RepID=A0A0G1CJG6_9BACT|nr:MAG: hypothetical protein UV04_C0006G0051 [Candidatus Gottesmanbacteria bacterium GW2011_GWA2_42_16]KKS52992.1 MAG: hypothetical protein UV17_C0041G0001 [Candidatus Gottesmanbacteria bacterium GW2011_GWA1_42_26]KKS80846.1 MAG: hypothetical protein UV55_C0028G0019 [Candidatus Gottesmanbacteria bacterium GW2011_GWC1_43_10]KKS85629.1 MAG: hypothetical protein UV61_C0016G0001 [Candidatus Gottesmanbacteria bacterium GW2011_GWB1_43_11]OGG27867.1 MAG: hypothetical protein A3A59_00670 [Candidatus Go
MKQVSYQVLFFLFFFFLFFPPQILAVETTVKDMSLSPSAPYIDTGIDLFIGSYLDIKQWGSAALYIPGMTQSWVGLAGDGGCTADINYTLPGVNCWSLVARIGANPPFLVGSRIATYLLQSGRLYLGINHKLPFSGTGYWNMRIIVNWTPPPPPPTPFLKLPWDYLGQGLSFSDAALKINSYFDHEYPLLSSGLLEPVESQETVTNYRGEFRNPKYPYSSHDGYDWGRLAGAPLDTPVLAAAAGCAIYKSDCTACGNAILINHGNYYQTRYYHLQPTDLITTSTIQCVDVTQGQMIGKVGFSGNVVPGGEAGAHLHFMLVEDKDRDGDFNDNIPDGLTDPFGWQSLAVDPWSTYSFTYAGESKLGNDSHYLWTDAIPNLSQDLPTNGGFYTFQKLKLNFPEGSVAEKTKLLITSAPIVVISDVLQSVGTGFIVTVQNLFGTFINQFNQDFTLTFDFTDEEIARFKPETLTIYSSSDGTNWQPEITTVDFTTKTASAELDHLTQFALVGELKDTTAPQTQILFNGTNINPGQFAPPVEISLPSSDIEGSVSYTLYNLNDSGWQQYLTPFQLADPGEYTIQYYSVDIEENTETSKSVSFTIISDTTPPEVDISFDSQTLTPVFTAIDENPVTETVEALPKNRERHTFTDTFANQLVFTGIYTLEDQIAQFRIESLQYNTDPIIIPEANILEVRYLNPASSVTNVFGQEWIIKDELQLKLVYTPLTPVCNFVI